MYHAVCVCVCIYFQVEVQIAHARNTYSVTVVLTPSLARPLLSSLFSLLDTADTGNSCQHQGYAEFNPASWPSSCAPNKEDWINEAVGFCGDGDAYPEEFWNCADISITSGEQILALGRFGRSLDDFFRVPW